MSRNLRRQNSSGASFFAGVNMALNSTQQSTSGRVTRSAAMSQGQSLENASEIGIKNEHRYAVINPEFYFNEVIDKEAAMFGVLERAKSFIYRTKGLSMNFHCKVKKCNFAARQAEHLAKHCSDYHLYLPISGITLIEATIKLWSPKNKPLYRCEFCDFTCPSSNKDSFNEIYTHIVNELNFRKANQNDEKLIELSSAMMEDIYRHYLPAKVLNRL